MGAVALVLAATFCAAGALVVQIAFEQGANAAADDVVSQDRYSSLELVSVSVAFGIPGPVSVVDEREVTVVVSRPADRPYPNLARTLSAHIERETGRSVTVTVEYLERRRYDPDASRSVPPPDT
ncbi:hypothetical protein [Halobaculum gomorrense]|uniref:Uncharacterized protein n=1 Tax=Halobaculum gomorrense TaxID=43928 RepID=A0A1M5NVJ2_9EURY|nr:hypothetical protein [Halobaculum gomorrense]SHG93551.1 hypothetical protein SAMN05443636_1361 [Halobaculum gomorrense]